MSKYIKRLGALLALTASAISTAQELHNFTNGEVADADKVNENFQQLLNAIRLQQQAIDVLNARILALETTPNQFATTYDGRITGDAVVSEDGLTISGEIIFADGVAYVASPIAEGKHYWEVTAHCGPDQRGFQIGIVGSDNETLNSWDAIQAATGYFGILTDGARKVNAYDKASNPPVTFSDGRLPTYAGDVFNVAVDMDNLTMYFGKNGVWLGNSSPSNNENPAYVIASDHYYAVVVVGAEQCVPHAMTSNFGGSDFSYPVPSGYFKGYCPSNDCEIAY